MANTSPPQWPSGKTCQQSICCGAEQGGSKGWATLVTVIWPIKCKKSLRYCLNETGFVQSRHSPKLKPCLCPLLTGCETVHVLTWGQNIFKFDLSYTTGAWSCWDLGRLQGTQQTLQEGYREGKLNKTWGSFLLHQHWPLRKHFFLIRGTTS